VTRGLPNRDLPPRDIDRLPDSRSLDERWPIPICTSVNLVASPINKEDHIDEVLNHA
jgi:hypothetical protein